MVIGIDGGGTSSRLVAVDASGGVRGPFRGGSTNLASNPPDVVRQHLEELLRDLLRDTGQEPDSIGALCIGSAGVDIPANVRQMEGLLRDVGLTCPLLVCNDVEIALATETGAGPGIVLVCGTGSVCFGKNSRGETHRVGGWGHLVGDEGSGYWIAAEAIRRGLHVQDGRLPPSLLPGLLCREQGIRRLDDILPFVYGEGANKSRIGALGYLVDRAAGAGDTLAAGILADAGKHLLRMVQAAAESLSMTGAFPIVLSGSTVLKSEGLRAGLLPGLRRISPDIRDISREPYMGAVYLAQSILPKTQGVSI